MAQLAYDCMTCGCITKAWLKGTWHERTLFTNKREGPCKDIHKVGQPVRVGCSIELTMKTKGRKSINMVDGQTPHL